MMKNLAESFFIFSFLNTKGNETRKLYLDQKLLLCVVFIIQKKRTHLKVKVYLVPREYSE